MQVYAYSEENILTIKNNNMKIDFKRIEIKDIEGKTVTRDVSKELGKHMYYNSMPADEMEVGREIYTNGAVDLNPARAKAVKKYADEIFFAFVRNEIDKLLDKIINDKGV